MNKAARSGVQLTGVWAGADIMPVPRLVIKSPFKTLHSQALLSFFHRHTLMQQHVTLEDQEQHFWMFTEIPAAFCSLTVWLSTIFTVREWTFFHYALPINFKLRTRGIMSDRNQNCPHERVGGGGGSFMLNLVRSLAGPCKTPAQPGCSVSSLFFSTSSG